MPIELAIQILPIVLSGYFVVDFFVERDRQKGDESALNPVLRMISGFLAIMFIIPILMHLVAK